MKKDLQPKKCSLQQKNLKYICNEPRLVPKKNTHSKNYALKFVWDFFVTTFYPWGDVSGKKIHHFLGQLEITKKNAIRKNYSKTSMVKKGGFGKENTTVLFHPPPHTSKPVCKKKHLPILGPQVDLWRHGLNQGNGL